MLLNALFHTQAPVFTIPGRTFPVETFYLQSAHTHYLDKAVDAVMEIHRTKPDGDILLFLTGQSQCIYDTHTHFVFALHVCCTSVCQWQVSPINLDYASNHYNHRTRRHRHCQWEFGQTDKRSGFSDQGNGRPTNVQRFASKPLEKMLRTSTQWSEKGSFVGQKTRGCRLIISRS